MLTLTARQMARFDATAEARFHGAVRDFLARSMGLYLDDLAPAELDRFTAQAIASARELGLATDRDVMRFTIPCAVFGALSWHDPLFADVYTSRIAWCDARRRRSAEAIVAALGRVLDREFAEVSGVELMDRLDRAFLAGRADPETAGLRERAGMPDLFGRFFPARLARLAPGDLEAHLGLSAAAARRVGLTGDPGILFYQQVAFFIGARFAEDRLYPWAATALAEDAPEPVRLRRLRTALRVIVRRARNQT